LLFRRGTEELLVNGVFVPEKNHSLGGAQRKEYRKNRVDWQNAESWYRVLRGVLDKLEGVVAVKIKDAVEGLHDVKTAVNLIVRNAEAVAEQYSGRDDDERVEAAPHDMKSLLKSVELLNRVLEMSSILANPGSAAFGRKHRMPVYRVLHRMVRLFEQSAASQGVEVSMAGTSFQAPECFDSFEVIGQVLIDNAIKYSRAGGTVIVRVDDVSDGVCVSVESFGPLIAEGMENAVFQRGVRAQSGRAKGSGLGLYVASVVAAAHGFQIRYSRKPERSQPEEGWNIFSFEVSELGSGDT
jgi:signal transduction histidine kinase